MSTDMEHNDFFGLRTMDLITTQASFTFLFLFSFYIVSNKYLETDVPTNQKVLIKYPIV